MTVMVSGVLSVCETCQGLHRLREQAGTPLRAASGEPASEVLRGRTWALRQPLNFAGADVCRAVVLLDAVQEIPSGCVQMLRCELIRMFFSEGGGPNSGTAEIVVVRWELETVKPVMSGIHEPAMRSRRTTASAARCASCRKIVFPHNWVQGPCAGPRRRQVRQAVTPMRSLKNPFTSPATNNQPNPARGKKTSANTIGTTMSPGPPVVKLGGRRPSRRLGTY